MIKHLNENNQNKQNIHRDDILMMIMIIMHFVSTQNEKILIDNWTKLDLCFVSFDILKTNNSLREKKGNQEKNNTEKS